MNTDKDNHKNLVLLQKSLKSPEGSFCTNQSISCNNMKLSNMIMQSRKTQSILKQISSTFLKHTVTKMFSQKRLQQLQPIIRQSSPKQQQFKIQKSKSVMQSLKIKINDHPLQAQKVYKQSKTQTKQFVSSQFCPLKIPKSYSESKKDADFVDSGYFELRKSLDKIEDMKNKVKQKSNKSSRSNSQESEHKAESSKTILKKLQQLHHKQTYNNVSCKESRAWSLPKTLSKELKSPGFVVRHKLSRQMYGQQRQQIKLLTKAIENFKGLDLAKGLKVKNYANFFPKIININN